MTKILIISNDKIFLTSKKISSVYNDTINIIEAINKDFNIYLISRISKFKNNFSSEIKNKILRLNLKLLFSLKKKRLKIFMISITPRNVLFYFIIKLFIKNIDGYVFLRSNGHKEYNKKIGKLGLVFYDIMQKYIEKHLKVISVSKEITSSNIKFFLNPSELKKIWFEKIKKVNLDIPKLLYFGRFRKEKGVYSLINLAKNFKFNYELTIAGDSSVNYPNNENINFLNEFSEIKKIIKLYDTHNIFILPSFTEGAPKVILESLARKRPVIVFKEIKHVKLNFKGIFVCDRNTISLKKCINFIMRNYEKIQGNMKNNNLPTKKIFQKKLLNILYE
tara:strand:+ start:1480 stop:2481 length:1002 start_codon:yes stop_codon:yes gene_type:complete